MPPHAPYRTRLDFYDHFQEDGLDWANKPRDVFTQKLDAARLKLLRAYYDEFILYIDDQFQKLMNRLETSGLLKDTWVVLTSDHGEEFREHGRGCQRGDRGDALSGERQEAKRIGVRCQRERADQQLEISGPRVKRAIERDVGRDVRRWRV